MKMRNRVIFAMFMLLAILLLCGFEGKAGRKNQPVRAVSGIE
ncbi:MAG: hypothetical protein ACOX8M_03060 [Marvinbryantia sp.]